MHPTLQEIEDFHAKQNWRPRIVDDPSLSRYELLLLISEIWGYVNGDIRYSLNEDDGKDLVDLVESISPDN